MDSLERRWARLEPFVTAIEPEDGRRRPAILLFHGCGGLRAHLWVYAKAASALGWRAYIIDSFAARGWNRPFVMATVCTGLNFRGRERGGDVLAAIHGLSRRAEVDASRLCLAGWSHGSWGMMEAMSAEARPGALGLANPQACALSGVKGAWLAYPYVGFLAVNRARPWRHRPRTLGVIARRDHLGGERQALALYAGLAASGLPVETWVVDATHAFDEPEAVAPMRYDRALTETALDRFRGFLETLA